MAAGGKPPSGLVTFVFTDIEGSTRLFHRLGHDFVGLLERHDTILSDVWEEWRGYEVTREGDGFLVAFGSPDDALRACAQGQRVLAREQWPRDARVSVRMGVHTGLASPIAGNYVALAVHESARIVAAAHGGQVLVSQDTADAAGALGDLALLPVGLFQLRGFETPVPLFQLTGPGLADEFPAVRAVPAGHHNIVRRPTATIGRAPQIDAVGAEVQPGRLVTLAGPGGIGKTTLAAEVGMAIAPSWKDGVWLVDLAGIEGEGAVVAAIGGAVGASHSSDRDRWDDVVEHLTERQAVVILDNCEHVLEACTRLSGSLRAQCPQIAVLVTSRIPLGLQGELVWPVSPLGVPGAAVTDAAAVLASPGGRLFAERGAVARPGFAVDGSNAADVAEIVRRLDGVPLSLELAAAHLAVQSPAEIRRGLEDRFRLLRRRRPRPSDRHSSVEDLLEWSYRGLGDDEKAAFRRLAIFSTGFSIDTATPAVATMGLEPAEVPPLVFSLVDRSLVVADLGADATRYRLMETFRAYGRRLLDRHQETGVVAASAAEKLLERTGPWIPADGAWLAEIDAEVENLRGLLPLLADDREEVAQQIACSIGRYHDAVQTFRAGVSEVGRYVAALPEPTPTRVSLLTTLADLHLRLGDTATALELVADAVAIRDRVGSPAWDDVGIDKTRGEAAHRAGDLTTAAKIAEEALARRLSDRGRWRMFNLLGATSAALGDMEAASQAFEAELELSRLVGHEGYAASAHGNLAELALRLGDTATAARHQAACLDLAVARGSKVMVAFSLIVAARIAAPHDDWESASLLLAKGEALLGETGLELYEDDRRQCDDLADAARREMGEEAFARVSTTGGSTGTPAAVARAARVFEEAMASSAA